MRQVLRAALLSAGLAVLAGCAAVQGTTAPRPAASAAEAEFERVKGSPVELLRIAQALAKVAQEALVIETRIALLMRAARIHQGELQDTEAAERTGCRSASTGGSPELGVKASIRKSAIVKPAYSSGARPISLRP
jgi:hypothetical protein